MVDIIVIGGGPAGSVAAKMLSDNGFSVTLFEKEKIPRHKHCAGFITDKPFKFLRSIGIDCERVLSPVNGLTFKCGNDIFSVTSSSNDVIQGNVYREEFDTLLIDYAKESGTRVIDNAKVFQIEDYGGKKERYHVYTQKGKETGQIIIGADGASSFVRKYLGISYNKNALAVSVEAEIPVNDKILDIYKDNNFYDIGFVKNGYVWIFPKRKGKTLNVGVWMYSLDAQKLGIPLFTVLKDYLYKCDWFKGPEVKPHGYIIPYKGIVEKLGDKNIILIGDAGGFVGAGGEGIPFALESSLNASRAAEEFFNGKSQSLVDSYSNISRNLIEEVSVYSTKLNKYLFSPTLIKIFIQMANKDAYMKNIFDSLATHSISYKEVLDNLSYSKVIKAFIKSRFARS